MTAKAPVCPGRFSLRATARAVHLAVVLLSIGLLLPSGCNRSDRPPLGSVTGTVTLDGRPLRGARLIFEPLEGGRASVGETDVRGRYELTYIRREKGAKVGEHRVRVTAARSDASAPEPLPPRYNDRTELRRRVVPGVNRIDLQLTSR